MIKRKWGICNMRYSIIVVTAVSGCLFCSIMIFSTLSPLPRGDSFNSAGMWINVALLLFVYILSLVFYIAGFNCMNYVIAVFCGLCLLFSLSIVALTLIVIAWISSVSGFLMLLLLSSLATLTNISRYVVAFRKSRPSFPSIIRGIIL